MHDLDKFCLPNIISYFQDKYYYCRHAGYPNEHANLGSCDLNDCYAERRLCWSMSSNEGRFGGDRCGSFKNLHNSKLWERIIYQSI